MVVGWSYDGGRMVMVIGRWQDGGSTVVGWL